MTPAAETRARRPHAAHPAPAAPAIEPGADWAPWAACNPSSLAHHGGNCCTAARAWFLAMDRSFWQGHGGPGWIPRRWPWGPSRWPLHWCEAVRADELDCGAHAFMTREAFRARGVRAVPVQLVQRQERHHYLHWLGRWNGSGASPAWAGEGAAYHEACATIAGGRAEVWDASVGAWLSPEHVRGVRSIAAVRIGGAEETGEVVTWRGVRVPLGVWITPPTPPEP
ncbi:hypothetical protein [Longimicrobium sp.]|uniref:hypothetical protein n=1 Tax=Longimicrobium sp. TaxID=2029185 RepID=UPI002B6B6951|nr:hypothetical protein [Longimicrobium sp.]HSU14143.1 hypothetical protein [Longimicrobium sp.]